TSDEVLRPEHGSLYPALHRLERKGWVVAKWERHRERNRVCRYYRLTPAGRRQLTATESKWKRLQEAIARVMGAASREAGPNMAMDDELDRELRTHLELEAAERRDEGLTPGPAPEAARPAPGGQAPVREHARPLSP